MTKKHRTARIHSHYRPRLDAAQEHYDVLDWASAEAQTARFQVLVDILERRGLLEIPQKTSLLDVGCGLTDLASFLQDQGRRVEYTGLELVPEMAETARKKFPERNIVVADIVEHPPFEPDSFDCVFCSGVFNLETGDNHTYIEHALRNVTRIARNCAVVNFLHERARFHYGHCHYYSPTEMLAIVDKLGVKAEIIDNYIENDFTLEISTVPWDG